MPDFPIVLEKRGKKVAIYRTRESGFRIQWRVGAQRKARVFALLTDAQAEAKRILDVPARGAETTTLLGPNEADIYRRAERFAREVDLSVDEVCRRYAEASAKLPEGFSLSDVIARFLSTEATVTRISVSDAIDAYMEPRRNSISEYYFKKEMLRLNKFRLAFQCDLADVDRKTLGEFIEAQGGAPKTRNHLRATIRGLIAWAVKHDFLPTTHRLNEALQAERALAKDTEVYTPHELRQILLHAADIARPRIALSAWAGLRTAEALRVTQENILDDYVVVEAKQSKTKSRRLIPLNDALRDYLKTYSNEWRTPWPLKENRRNWEIFMIGPEASDFSGQLSSLIHYTDRSIRTAVRD